MKVNNNYELTGYAKRLFEEQPIRIVAIEKQDEKWSKLRYKTLPRGRKVYSMFIYNNDVIIKGCKNGL